jgi:hypothetical protein
MPHPIRCGKCDECLQREAAKVERRVIRRIEARKDKNDSLVVSQLLNVPTADVMALQKRIQRDSTAHYYRGAINAGGGYDFIIQSEKEYGPVVDVVEYDFALAAKIAKAKDKRQTGLLYSQKSKKIATDEKTYSLSMTKITAKKASDSKG